MNDKQYIRRILRQRRRFLSPSAQMLAAQQVALRLWQMPRVRRASRIAAYWPADGELSALVFLKQAHKRGKSLFLPSINPLTRQLRFVSWQPHQKLYRNCFGIPEPATSARALDPEKLDVMLLPLVGFDCNGRRLGMGGGFYDRTLAKVNRQRVCLVGLAHYFQEIKHLPAEKWDVDLDAIVTPKRWIVVDRTKMGRCATVRPT